MNILLRTTTLMCLAALPITALSAPDAPSDKPQKGTPNENHRGRAYLGVAVSSVHPALATNLPDLISPEQGLIVENVEAGSPAAVAGIRLHDILIEYGDQKLFSTDQLAKLIRASKPGSSVEIEVLREGKLQKFPVKLGESEVPQGRMWPPPRPYGQPRFGGPWPFAGRLRPRSPANEWANFDSLTLKKIGDHKFRAEIQYLDKDGNTQKHAFEGTREEIRKQVESEKDLRPGERAHLLRSLNLATMEAEFDAPEFWLRPGPDAWFGPLDEIH